MEKLPVIFQWNLTFSALLVCILLIVLYYKPVITKGIKASISFWISILLIILAECSPLHYLGMHFYFQRAHDHSCDFVTCLRAVAGRGYP